RRRVVGIWHREQTREGRMMELYRPYTMCLVFSRITIHPYQAQGAHMATTTRETSRTSRLLALMTKGDDAFNARDFAAVDTVHHPDMVAHITGNAQPIYGSVAHAA